MDRWVDGEETTRPNQIRMENVNVENELTSTPDLLYHHAAIKVEHQTAQSVQLAAADVSVIRYTLKHTPEYIFPCYLII